MISDIKITDFNHITRWETNNLREFVDSEDFFNSIKGDCLVVVGSPTCQPCKRLVSMVSSLPFDKVIAYKANIEDFIEELFPYRIMSVPTLLFFKNGEVVDRCGMIKNTDLIEKVENFLKGK